MANGYEEKIIKLHKQDIMSLHFDYIQMRKMNN